MKKNLKNSFILLIIAVIVFWWGVSSIIYPNKNERQAKMLAEKQNEKQKNYCDSIDDIIMTKGLYGAVIVRNPKPYIYVGEENFEKLVNYIERNGTVYNNLTGLPSCEYLLSFLDSDGNRHFMITVKCNEAGEASPDGTVNKIFAQINYGGKENGEIWVDYFFYNINKDKIVIEAPNDIRINEHRLAVKHGYEEILAYAKR